MPTKTASTSAKSKKVAKATKTSTTVKKSKASKKVESDRDNVVDLPVAGSNSVNGVSNTDMTLEDELREMVMEVKDLPLGQRRTVLLDLAEQYPNNIWPFAGLSVVMGRAKDNLEMAERGLANASKYEDPNFLKQHRGHYWEMRETQGYIRLLLHKARGLMDLRRLDAAIELLEKTLDL